MNFSTSLYYDPTTDINSFYAQQQSIAEQAAQRQAEILLQQYERSVAAQKEARAKQEAAVVAADFSGAMGSLEKLRAYA